MHSGPTDRPHRTFASAAVTNCCVSADTKLASFMRSPLHPTDKAEMRRADPARPGRREASVA
jgi:hypothetical protein